MRYSISADRLPDHLAKIEADEYLTALSKQRGADFDAIILRPGTLKDDPPTGKISLGKTRASGPVTRGDVADVTAKLLDTGYSGWIDLLQGDEDAASAVAHVVKEKVDCVEGEDVEGWIQKHKL